MPTFAVTVPYTEKELGKESKRRTKDYAIEADDPLEAMEKAMQTFRLSKDNPYASWKVLVDHERIHAKDLESGKTFRLKEEGSNASFLDEGEVPLFNEAIFNMASRERLTVLEKALKLSREASDGLQAAASVLKLCQETVMAEAGAIVMYDSKQEDLYFIAASGPAAEKAMKYRVPCGKGLVGYCFDSGQTVAISNAHKDDRFYRKLQTELGFETRSVLATPLFYRRQVIGVMELINKNPDDNFTGNDSLIAQHLSDYLAILLMALKGR